MVKVCYLLIALAVVLCMFEYIGSSQRASSAEHRELQSQMMVQHELRAKEHVEMRQLLDEAAVQRETMAKQLAYIFNMVKAAQIKPDVGELSRK